MKKFLAYLGAIIAGTIVMKKTEDAYENRDKIKAKFIKVKDVIKEK